MYKVVNELHTEKRWVYGWGVKGCSFNETVFTHIHNSGNETLWICAHHDVRDLRMDISRRTTEGFTPAGRYNHSLQQGFKCASFKTPQESEWKHSVFLSSRSFPKSFCMVEFTEASSKWWMIQLRGRRWKKEWEVVERKEGARQGSVWYMSVTHYSPAVYRCLQFVQLYLLWRPQK